MKLTLDSQEETGAAGGSALRVPAPHESVFEAEVLEVKHQNSRWKFDNSDEFKKEFNFKFRVLDAGDFHDRFFWGSTPEWFSNDPRCKLQRWIKSVYDEPVLPQGFELDTDDLADMRCIIVIHAKEKAFREDGEHLNQDGSAKMVNWVADVLPSKAARIAPTTPTPNPDNLEPF